MGELDKSWLCRILKNEFQIGFISGHEDINQDPLLPYPLSRVGPLKLTIFKKKKLLDETVPAEDTERRCFDLRRMRREMADEEMDDEVMEYDVVLADFNNTTMVSAEEIPS